MPCIILLLSLSLHVNLRVNSQDTSYFCWVNKRMASASDIFSPLSLFSSVHKLGVPFESSIRPSNFHSVNYSESLPALFHSERCLQYISMCIRVSDTATRQFSGSLVLVRREIWIKCIHPSIDIGIHIDTHKLFDHYSVFSVFCLRNASEEIVLISKCSFSFRRAYLSFLSSTLVARILRHLPSYGKEKRFPMSWWWSMCFTPSYHWRSSTMKCTRRCRH